MSPLLYTRWPGTGQQGILESKGSGQRGESTYGGVGNGISKCLAHQDEPSERSKEGMIKFYELFQALGYFCIPFDIYYGCVLAFRISGESFPLFCE